MKWFRTRRAAPPWAGGQTGPLTADVEALMSNRDSGPVKDPVKYVSPLNVRHEYVPPAAPVTETTPVAMATEAEADALVERALADANQESIRRLSAVFYPEPQEATAAQSVEFPEPQGKVSTPEATAIAPKRSHHKPKRTKRKPRPIPAFKDVTLRPAAPRGKSQPKAQTEVNISHHERRCSICHHPDREAIEEAFLQWRRVKNIDFDFKPEGGVTAIYRHARALKLFKQRNLGLRSALEFVIERAENVVPSAEGLVKAIRAYTRINEQGEWIDSPTTHIVKVMPMRDPEPRNVTNSASPYPDEARGSVTLDVKKISDCPREGKVEVTVESPTGRPLLTGSAPQTESGATT
jgi:hypothetical protein